MRNSPDGVDDRFEQLRCRALESLAAAAHDPGTDQLDALRVDVNRFLRYHRKLQDDAALAPGQDTVFHHAVHVFHTLLWEPPGAPSIPVLHDRLGELLGALTSPEVPPIDLIAS